MFIVLTVEREEKGPLARAVEYLGRSPLKIYRKSFLGNGYYHIVDHVSRANGSPHWRLLAQATGRAAVRLVAEEGVEPPPGCGLRLYQSGVFAGRIAAMAGVQLLRMMGEEGRRATVALVDEDGLFSWCAGELARQCALLRVYTRRPERYAVLCRELMEGFGASLLLADTPEGLAGSSFAVAPAPTGVWKLPLPVLTVDRSGIQGRPTVNRLEPDLPPEILREVPEGIPAAQFLGAAWETGLRRFPLDMGIRACRVDGRLVPFREGMAAVLGMDRGSKAGR